MRTPRRCQRCPSQTQRSAESHSSTSCTCQSVAIAEPGIRLVQSSVAVAIARISAPSVVNWLSRPARFDGPVV